MDGSGQAFTEKAELARRWLHSLLQAMGVAHNIEVSCSPEVILLNVQCPHDGHVAIGRRGGTLEALQLLVQRIVFRDGASPAPRLVVDIEGYRERRRRQLVDLARRSAAQVREEGIPVCLPPLCPSERYIVHQALASEPGVTSGSRGEGEFKQVVVSPDPGKQCRTP